MLVNHIFHFVEEAIDKAIVEIDNENLTRQQETAKGIIMSALSSFLDWNVKQTLIIVDNYGREEFNVQLFNKITKYYIIANAQKLIYVAQSATEDYNITSNTNNYFNSDYMGGEGLNTKITYEYKNSKYIGRNQTATNDNDVITNYIYLIVNEVEFWEGDE